MCAGYYAIAATSVKMWCLISSITAIIVIIVVVIIIIIIIIIFISFIYGIHSYVPESNHVPTGYTVAVTLSFYCQYVVWCISPSFLLWF